MNALKKNNLDFSFRNNYLTQLFNNYKRYLNTHYQAQEISETRCKAQDKYAQF